MKHLIVILLVALVGCSRPTTKPGSVIKMPVLTYEGITTESSAKSIVIKLKNLADRPIEFFEITPSGMVCSIEVQVKGVWTDLNQVSYCLTHWPRITLQPGESHSMKLAHYPLTVPWRVAMSFWVGDVSQSLSVYGGPFEPIEKPDGQSSVQP